MFCTFANLNKHFPRSTEFNKKFIEMLIFQIFTDVVNTNFVNS